MTAHLHPQHVPGCFRCELSRDEAFDALADERDELQADRDLLTRLLDGVLADEPDSIRAAVAWLTANVDGGADGVGGGVG